MAKTPENPEPQSNNRGSLIEWFAQNHVAANIMMFLFLIGGVISLSNMRTETFPSIDPRLITITVAYPGATPYEVADGITSRVEETLTGIDGVKRITSTASEGFGIVSVELEDFANADDIYNDVETAVNSLSNFPPEDAERVKVTKVRLTPDVMNLALHGNVSEETLKYWAEHIEDDLKQLEGVAKTKLGGIRDYQISVEVSEDTLRRFGLTLDDIGNAINNFSTDIPAGTIEAQQGDILLRVQEKRYTKKDFDQVIIRTLEDGSKLTLGQIANVDDSFDDSNLISSFNGERAAFISVSRSETDDTIRTANAVKEYLDGIELPAGLHISLQEDQTVSLRERINLMLRNSILGFMLVFVILLLFLDLKLAFWTSVAIPVSFMGGIMMINFFGYSLNMITLFALIVVLGIVVDDAIVTGESIFEMQKKRKNDPHAVLKGVRAIVAPVTVGVTTTMAAFAPLIFSTGTIGQIIGIIPAVVIPVLFISLLEAFFILPSHLSYPGEWSRGIIAEIRNNVSKAMHNFIDKRLLPVAHFSMKWRYATIAAFLAFGIITVSLFTSGNMRFIFFPQVESDKVNINVTTPNGTPFETTKAIMLEMEKDVQAVQNEIEKNGGTVFKSITMTIGETSAEAGPGSSGNESSGSNIAQIKVQLVSSDFRTQSAYDIENMIRKRVEDIPGIETLQFQSSLVGDEPDIDIELTHPEENILNKAAEDLKTMLSDIEGAREITDSFEPGKTEYVFELTPEGIAAGLTPAELGRQLRSAYFGLEAQRFQRGRSEIIVYVRYPKEERENIASLNDVRIRLADGSEMPLSAVAKIKQQRGYSQIQSVNARRIVNVTSDVDYTLTTPNDVIAIIKADLLPKLEAMYPGLTHSFEGQSREQAEDLASLKRNMMIALLLIYVLLGAQLRSYVQPLIIMSAIPFGIIGAIWGHFLLGHDLTFISLFGLVALSGVVVNDSVVLMDYYNQQRAEGYNLYESSINTLKRRFRPILLTTLTTSLGLLPMLLEKSMQAQFLIPMVISLATGILFASIIILFLIPNLVLIHEDIKKLPKKTVVFVKKSCNPLKSNNKTTKARKT